MTEYLDRPDEMQTRSRSSGATRSNKEALKAEIRLIERQLEHKVERARQMVHQTAEADRRDLERAEQKLRAIKASVKDGWSNVTEAAAAALLKLLK